MCTPLQSLEFDAKSSMLLDMDQCWNKDSWKIEIHLQIAYNLFEPCYDCQLLSYYGSHLRSRIKCFYAKPNAILAKEPNA